MNRIIILTLKINQIKYVQIMLQICMSDKPKKISSPFKLIRWSSKHEFKKKMTFWKIFWNIILIGLVQNICIIWI